MKLISKKRAKQLQTNLMFELTPYCAEYKVKLYREPLLNECFIRVFSPNGYFGSCVIGTILQFARVYSCGLLSLTFCSKDNFIQIDLY